MSKSLGNFVSTPEVFNKYGADASRQWAAAGGSTGTDIPFRWEDVEYGWRFMRKLWNACRFAGMRMEDYDPTEKVEPQLLDKWILSKLEGTVRKATEAMEICDFMNATEAARNFIWHVFCDHYLEAAKTRLYGDGDGKKSAQQTMYYVVRRMLQLIAPIVPHLTEEIWRYLYDHEGSIHISEWPTPNEGYIDEATERKGDVIIEVISEMRREKNRLGLSLNAPLAHAAIYADKEKAEALTEGLTDIQDTLKINNIDIDMGTGGVHKVEAYPSVGFTILA